MPTAAHHNSVPRIIANIEVLSAEDFETASIRSAAPSYISEVPSYHSTAANSEPIPAYSPPASAPALASVGGRHHGQAPSLLAPADETTPSTIGLPPIPQIGRRAASEMPDLLAFRIPPWSMTANNPAIRHYRNVAHRRVSAAAANLATSATDIAARRPILDSVSESPEPSRPLEDPYLVGEEAARRARAERLARENGDAILVMEDRRWDTFLLQMKEWDERDRTSTRHRRETHLPRGRLARRFALR